MKTLASFYKFLRDRKIKIGNNILKLSLYFTGAAALIWFIIRVLPKPSRASYPCQRAAFPIASAFVMWITGAFLSRSIVKKARINVSRKKHMKASVLMLLAVVVFIFSVFAFQIKDVVYGAIDFASVSQAGKKLYAKEKANQSGGIIDPEATVAIVQSDKANAYDITFSDINTMIRQAVDMAGGFDTLIHEGDLVVIKPNVIAGRAQGASYSNAFPDEANGIATDYRIIQVVVNMVREKNSTGKIVLIEGSGYGLTRKNINAIGYDNIIGLDSIICLDENITGWYNTGSPNLQKVSLPDGQNLYSAANQYYLHKIYYEADVLISLPCLKSHFLTGITGAVKNVGIGATPVEMYGNGTSVPEDDLPGRWNHIQHGDFATQTVPLDRWIHDFYLCKPVDYVIMDGLQGAEYGPYPGSNSSHTLSQVQKNLRIILAGNDALAVDAIEALIAGFDPYRIGHLVLLANHNAGCINPAWIKVKGVQVHQVKTPFNEDNPGKKCIYTDFTAPAGLELISCIMTDSEINISLSTGDDITKVEVAYNDTILEPIIVNDFDSFAVPFDKPGGDARKVSVLLYDQYLNCSVLTLEHPVISGFQSCKTKPLSLHPNPANTHLNVDIPESMKSRGVVTVYSAGEKLVLYQRLSDEIEKRLDISLLKPGIFTIVISDGKGLFQGKFCKL